MIGSKALVEVFLAPRPQPDAESMGFSRASEPSLKCLKPNDAFTSPALYGHQVTQDPGADPATGTPGFAYDPP